MRYIILALALLAAATPTEAQTHAYLTSERVSGQTKTCYYEANGNVYTSLIGRSNLCPLSIRVAAPLPRPAPAPGRKTVTAYLTGEAMTGQMRQCFYDYVGDVYTWAVRDYQVCPLSIQVRR